MNIKDDYESILEHWTEEKENVELSDFNDKILSGYKKIIDDVKTLPSNQGDHIKDRLLKSYKDNFNFMFEDLLKLRKLKIINAAIALASLNFNRMSDAERLLYKNMVAAIKGYDKVKNLSIAEDAADIIREDTLVPETPLPVEETLAQKEQVLESNAGSDFEELDVSDLFDSESIEERTSSDKPPPNLPLKVLSKFDGEETSEEYQYALVRILEDVPPIIGVDLLVYGPFEKEDVANIPLKNANILISEEFAELLKIGD